MNEDLPIKDPATTIASLESMNLDVLKDKLFCVSISTGDRSKSQYLCAQLRGPFNFEEMCEEVGNMWKTHQHHAKVIILEKDRNKSFKVLDELTVDYIEVNYLNIITESMLQGRFDGEYTCRANVVETEE